MKTTSACLTTALLPALVLVKANANVEIAACTERGAFTIELLDEHAPRHTANFLAYVERGAYSGTALHRVVADELVQAGGYDDDLRPIVPMNAVPNESHNGLGNVRGTVAAARAADPDSATSQFFVNLADNTHLDTVRDAPGYTVFGRVTAGLDVLDAISRLPTHAAGPLRADVPKPLVEIVSMVRLDRPALESIAPERREELFHGQALATAAHAAPADVLAAVERYRASCPNLDPAVLLAEAEAAAALELPQRARAALDQYFERAVEDAPGRERALELRTRLTPGPLSTLERIAPACTAPMPADVTDGATASYDEMVETQALVHGFMDDSDAFLECLSVVIDEADLSERDHTIVVREHNRHVELMEDVANAFNAEVRRFRRSESQTASSGRP